MRPPEGLSTQLSARWSPPTAKEAQASFDLLGIITWSLTACCLVMGAGFPVRGLQQLLLVVELQDMHRKSEHGPRGGEHPSYVHRALVKHNAMQSRVALLISAVIMCELLHQSAPGPSAGSRGRRMQHWL